MTDLVNRNIYGTQEIGGLVDGPSYHANRKVVARNVPWTTPGLKITRLRLLSDPGCGWWDVSYCHGTLNGEDVDVDLPFMQLSKRGYRREIVQHAIRDGVHAQRMGALDNISTLC